MTAKDRWLDFMEYCVNTPAPVGAETFWLQYIPQVKEQEDERTIDLLEDQLFWTRLNDRAEAYEALKWEACRDIQYVLKEKK